MKKINVFLIIFTLICAFITIIGELDKGTIIILKDSSIILSLFALYIAEKIFKIKINDGFKTIWIIFIFMAHYLGVIAGMYNSLEYYDKITHTMSGILTAYLAMIILDHIKLKGKTMNILFIVSFSALCAVSWEVFEFVCNILVGGDAQKVLETGVDDTMLDMIVALLGSLVFSIWYVVNSKRLKTS